MRHIDTDILEAILSAAPQCELDYAACERTATERGQHPTGEALGETDWPEIWYCLPCAWQAARDS
ncbi:hypothetical protein [Streptomyces sp. NPDC015125]|uniref:hypothetical protein n=1 Tax=Streptomyces sp. NPDC015125 TaxID=3364938 RepID=UPI00370092AE